MTAKNTAKTAAPETFDLVTKAEAKKVTTKKAAEKNDEQPTKKAEPKQLSKPLVRILVALSKANKPMSRKEIGEKAKVDVPFLSTYIGSSDEATRLANEAKRNTKGLITLGYVRIVPSEEGQGTVYVITAAGKKALAKLD